MPRKVDISRDELELLYVFQRKPMSEIAEILGCSKATVANRLREYGLSRHATIGRRRITISEEALRHAYVYEGKRTRELAEMFSCSEAVISARIRKWNLREERNAFLDAEITRLLSEGMPYARVSDELGIGREQVSSRAKALGLATRRPEPPRDEEPAIKAPVGVTGDVSTLQQPKATQSASRQERSDETTSSIEAKECFPNGGSERSPRDEDWTAWVEAFGFPYERDVAPAPGAAPIALYLPGFRIGIDLAHTTERSVDIVAAGRSPIARRYHLRQSAAAEATGVRIIRIYDWDDESRIRDVIRSAVGLGERIHARKTKVVPVARRDEAAFLEANHLQGYVRSSFCYGLVDEAGRLVSVMSFCPPRYGNKDGAEWELLRLCSLTGVTVHGGASRLFAHFAREHRPHKVMSYCNYDISVGGVYEAMGFSFERLTSPSYTWARKDDPSEHYSWNVVNSVGYDCLFGTSYGKGTSNRELMLEHGFVRVYNAGNKVYVWTDEQWR